MSKSKALSYFTVVILLAGLTGCGAMGGGYSGAGAGFGTANQAGKYGQ